MIRTKKLNDSIKFRKLRKVACFLYATSTNNTRKNIVGFFYVRAFSAGFFDYKRQRIRLEWLHKLFIICSHRRTLIGQSQLQFSSQSSKHKKSVFT